MTYQACFIVKRWRIASLAYSTGNKFKILWTLRTSVDRRTTFTVLCTVVKARPWSVIVIISHRTSDTSPIDQKYIGCTRQTMWSGCAWCAVCWAGLACEGWWTVKSGLRARLALVWPVKLEIGWTLRTCGCRCTFSAVGCTCWVALPWCVIVWVSDGAGQTWSIY